MDDKGYKPSEGSCIISEDVIATIASTAALEVQGVASMAQRPTDIRGLISTAAAKSVKVLNNENETIMMSMSISVWASGYRTWRGRCSMASKWRCSR